MKKVLSFSISILFVSSVWLTPVSALNDSGISVERSKQQAREKLLEIESRSRIRIEELKTTVEKKTEEIRKKSCDARQENINKRIVKRSESATKHKNTFADIYSRVVEYAEEKNLNTNLELAPFTNEVEQTSDRVMQNIETLSNLDIKLDCSLPDEVAQKIDSYRSQLEEVKMSLKDYREAIRKYAQSVKKLAEDNGMNE